jgi:hypothetical protein
MHTHDVTCPVEASEEFAELRLWPVMVAVQPAEGYRASVGGVSRPRRGRALESPPTGLLNKVAHLHQFIPPHLGEAVIHHIAPEQDEIRCEVLLGLLEGSRHQVAHEVEAPGVGPPRVLRDARVDPLGALFEAGHVQVGDV